MRRVELRHIISLLLLTLLACSAREEQTNESPPKTQAESRCQKAVAHMMRLLTEGAPPSEGERKMMEGIAIATLAQCEVEGLSEEQLRCILSAETPQASLELGKCPAIAAKQPGWLRLPPAMENKP